jgi:adenylate kinase family enzyme
LQEGAQPLDGETTEERLRRVVVVGTSCAGKSTFSRRLADVIAAPHVELDLLHWGPNWTPRDDFRDAVARATKQPTWVVDGNYSVVRDLVWERCTTVIWLDYPFTVVFGRALRRTSRRVFRREALFAGNRETLTRALFDPEGVLWWVLRTYRRRRRELSARMAEPEYNHAEFVVLRSPADAEAFLERLERRQE